MFLVDEDTNAFNKIIDGFRMPKGTEEEQKLKRKGMDKGRNIFNKSKRKWSKENLEEQHPPLSFENA